MGLVGRFYISGGMGQGMVGLAWTVGSSLEYKHFRGEFAMMPNQIR